MAETTEGTSTAHEYDHLFDIAEPLGEEAVSATVEAAAVRPGGTPRWDATTEAIRQAGIAAADRQNREDAGLAPRPIDI